MRTLEYSSPSSVALLPLLVINSSPSAGKTRLYRGRRIDGKRMGTSKRSSPIHSIDYSRVCLVILVRVWLAHLSSEAIITHTLNIFSMLSLMFALKFGRVKRAKSARSFFIRPPLHSKIYLEYLKIDYTSIHIPDEMAYNGKPLSGAAVCRVIQSSHIFLYLQKFHSF